MTESIDQPPKRRRSHADERRNKRVNLAYNLREFQIIELAASRVHRAPSAYAASAALAVAAGAVSPLPMTDRELIRAFQDADVTLNRIGNNLNQIAAVLNSRGDVTAEHVAAVFDVVSRAAQALMQAGLDVARNQVER
ncbi:mobilisation protein (MobC) [Streptomyces sp. Ncost-T6T-2b]|nr:mobilisation protein (MobC) [Streptomyces sp. Ncost-T6T-2b]